MECTVTNNPSTSEPPIEVQDGLEKYEPPATAINVSSVSHTKGKKGTKDPNEVTVEDVFKSLGI